MSWWEGAVVYQVYPRSFQDSNGDGVGDLRGVLNRLDHLVWLGVDALWISPIYPSPMADFGYDVADHTAIDPTFGTLGDFDRLVAAAHERGLRVLMDIVPCHTSIEHRWFREHPDWYIWGDGSDGGPPNNWISAFGGPAWSQLEGRWYLHSFYPEQPDLDWRNPEVVEAMQGVLRFWLDRGVDGYRIDAIDRLLKDKALRDDPPAVEPFGLPLRAEEAALAMSMSRNAPDIGSALARIREACGDALLVGEVYLPSRMWQPYLEHLDAAFAFELFHAPWDAEALRSAIEATLAVREAGAAWVLSNHDFPRLPNRYGELAVTGAAVLACTLPGLTFLYQGDEIGMTDGSGATPPLDRAGRDRHRHPMQWDGTPKAGFTTGEPWLPPIDPEVRNVEAQRVARDSTLTLYRELIALRKEMNGPLQMVDAEPGVLAYSRGAHDIAVNTTAEPRLAPWGATLAPGGGLVRTGTG
jgi:alpha-glucosidase